MSVAIIAHVAEDRAYVETLTKALPAVRFIVCELDPVGPPLAFDARLPLVLVWSERAARARATRAFAALMRTHGGETILCAMDRHQPPKEFERLNCARVDGAPGSAFFPGGLGAAIFAADQRAKAVEYDAPQGGISAGGLVGSFGGGLARGIAGGAALFGAAAGVPLVMDAIAVQQSARPVDESFSVMDMHAAVDERVAPFDTASEADPYPTGFASGEPPEELVRLAQRVLNEADVPLASSARAEQVARRVHQAFGERQLTALNTVNDVHEINDIWAPDPFVTEPLENLADAPVLELTDEVGDDELQWDAPITTSAAGSARVLT
ncbi:MAG: hypothetical protein JNJ73_16130 [Hyphomonadaceae bacterium]|nr:hypothetical protein [Hyphomonadaceae bacterium]